jgi:hypothetical protein
MRDTKKHAQNLVENLNRRGQFEDLDVDETIILK